MFYFSSVEVADGRWISLLGRYKDWAGASSGAIEVAKLWGLAEVGKGRTGLQPARDLDLIWVLLLWGGRGIAAGLSFPG
jgi:hypothetical protein